MIGVLAAAAAASAVALSPGTPQSFESVSRVPEGWQLVQYTPGLSSASIQTGDAADGQRFLRITSTKANHARLMVPLAVEPNSTYRVTAQIRTKVRESAPAEIALDTSDSITSNAMPGDGRWRTRTLYIKTGDSDKVRIALSLGWFGDVVAGSADYDRIALTKVDAAPAGVPVAQAGESAAAAQAAAPAQPATNEPDGSPGILLPLGALIVLFAAVIGVIVLRGQDDRST